MNQPTVIAQIVAEASADVVPARRVAEQHAAGHHHNCDHPQNTDDRELDNSRDGARG